MLSSGQGPVQQKKNSTSCIKEVSPLSIGYKEDKGR
jgi:hypothetical protein